MKSFSIAALSLLAFVSLSYSQQAATVTVVERPNETTTLPTAQPTAAVTAAQASQNPTSTLTTTSSDDSSPTSVVQATRIQSGYPSGASSDPSYSGGVDTAGGASGSDSSSFNLSKGGLIAIIVVVVVVAVFGIASIILWVVAKRRQWNIRASIKRASRRLTGRADKAPQKDEIDRRKRSGMVAGSKKSETSVANAPGQKRGLAVQVNDVEKGSLVGDEAGGTQGKKDGAWKARLMGNNWR